MKRRLSDLNVREIVRARITKGDAFSMNNEDYEKKQEKVRQELNKMSRKDIFDKYPHATYDIKK